MKKLVYVAPLKWSSYSQRPHFMMRYIAETFDVKILWIDPFPARLPRLSDVSRRRDVYNQRTQLHPNIEIYSHRPLPIEPLVNCNKLYQRLFLRKFIARVNAFSEGIDVALGIGKPCCLARVFLETGSFRRSFYDAMDDYPEFHSGISKRYIASIERYIAECVNDVIVSSHYLEEKFIVMNRNVQLIPNGYDDSHARLHNDGDDVVLAKDVKTIGYVGTIYHWFDWGLVISIAKRVPQVIIKLIGPVLGDIPGNLPANIVMLPACPNNEAMEQMRSFDIGLIPFLKNNATRAVDPIKYYEYRALGLPVISTLFGDMQYKLDDPGLFIVSGSTKDQLVSMVDSAYAYRSNSKDFSLQVESTWPARFKAADILGEYFRVT